MLRAGLVTVLLAAVCLPKAAAAAGPKQPSLASRDWSLVAKPGLANVPPRIDDVRTLMADLSDRQNEPINFRFVDLRRSGTLSLVINGAPERCIDGQLTIVDKTNSGFEIYTAEESRAAEDPVVQDLDGTGKLELVVDVTYLFRCCACPDTIFPAIYEWTGLGYQDVSDRFPGFYRKKLKALQSKIDSATNTNAVSDRIIEAAKIKRFLGISPDAGLDYAITLANSQEWRDRTLAVQILRDIPGTRAEEELRTLSHDPMSLVAKMAAGAQNASSFRPQDTLRMRSVPFKDVVPAEN